jgi:D-glycerate 3-kinase
MSSPIGQVANISNQALRWLKDQTSMSRPARHALAALAPSLLAQVPHRHVASIAIAGPPGSGKSTLAGLLTFLLNASGRPAVLLSLDDYYLNRQRRDALARSHHALLQRRGVPGTHDWPRLLHDFDCLRQGHTRRLRLPVFDKSTDDVAPVSCWRSVGFCPSCLIVEGWCIGAPVQDAAALLQPVNELERLQDPQGSWRHFVNAQLARYYSDLEHRIDRFWYLHVPGWDRVIDWRWQQEQELAHPLLHSRVEVAAFLATFERIAGHMQKTSAAWADWRLQADSLHRLEIMQ